MKPGTKRFYELVGNERTDSLDRMRQRIADEDWLRRSQDIAMDVLFRLDELGWKRADLAEQLGVSRQQVSKITSGKENLTLKTITRLERVLDMRILVKPDVKPVQKQPVVVRVDVQPCGSFHYDVVSNTPSGRDVTGADARFSMNGQSSAA